MKKRDLITLGILAVIFLIIFIVIFLTRNKEEEVIENTEYNNLTLLTDESMFLSISRNINKITEYANNDSNVISYIVNNDIEINDYKNVSFEADEIYVVSRLNLYKYYVKGSLYRNVMDEASLFIRDEYFILNYDIDKLSYNIEVIDKNTYDNASSINYIFESINKNDYNRFEYSSLSPKTRAVMYFNDFLDLVYTNTEEAYNLVSSDTKQNYFNTYDDFKNFISNHNNISLKEYSVNNSEIGIKDNYNNEYIFEISYVLKYNVTINIAEE